MKTRLIAAAVAGGLMGLSACGDGGSAVETRDRAADAVASGAPTAPAALADGGSPETRPVLTANRRETADAKIQRLFARNGAAFGAETAEDYLEKIRAFTSRPPRDVERAERPNGDVLLYQASTNTFAVVARDGVAKTMFKPDDGAAYWAGQKAAAPTFGRRRSATGSEAEG